MTANNNDLDFSTFSTDRLKELKKVSEKLGLWDDVFGYDKELENRQDL